MEELDPCEFARAGKLSPNGVDFGPGHLQADLPQFDPAKFVWVGGQEHLVVGAWVGSTPTN